MQISKAYGKLAESSRIAPSQQVGCTFIQGHARFESSHSIVVNEDVLEADKDIHQRRRARHCSHVTGIRDVPFLTNSSMIDIDFCQNGP